MGMSGYWFQELGRIENEFVRGEITEGQFDEKLRTFYPDKDDRDNLIVALLEERNSSRPVQSFKQAAE